MVVAMWLMPRDGQKAAQGDVVNWETRSEVNTAGTPKLQIHLVRVAMQVLAEVSQTWKVAGQRVEWFTTLNTCVKPLTAGKGPTRSMWTCEKWGESTSMR